jgi:DNA polymerase I-like protein with 3'-5' exonuclease and polymerase domains
VKIVGIDTETYDPYLREKGVSWVYGEGHVLCTSLYYKSTGKKKVVKGATEEVKNLLLSPDVTLVGANIGYDIGWLEYALDIKGQTKAKLIDVIMAETLIDEYDLKGLEYLGQKYLKRGKVKGALEQWAEDNELKGDFRKHLKDAPWDLLKEYAADDAELPVIIYDKQYPILEAQGLLRPFEIDCAMIKVVLKMKQRGVRIDVAKKEANKKILEDRLKEKRTLFERKYGAVNLNSPKQVAALLDRCDIPYRVKFNLKGRNGQLYTWDSLKRGVFEVNEIVKGFKRKKGQILCYIDKQYKERMSKILLDAGFVFTANPNVDKKYLATIADEYPVTQMIQDIKQIDGILSKFIGDGFNRYIVDGRVHPDFNVSKNDEYGTISGRLSSSNPNGQQIPSKGDIDKGTDRAISLPEMCRGIFIPEENCWMLKIDYSQIEYRLLVHYASGLGSAEAREKFNTDPKTDYHQFVMDLTGLERKPAKNCNFGILYGMGPLGMQEAFGWTPEFVDNVLSTYRDSLPFVFSTMEKVAKTGETRGYIVTIGGRRARLRSKELAYTMLNRLNQGGSADMMKAAMVKADADGVLDFLSAHLTVHDELVCSVPKSKEGLDAVLQLKEIMETVVPLRIPVVAEAELGTDWYNVEEFDYDKFLKEITPCKKQNSKRK